VSSNARPRNCRDVCKDHALVVLQTYRIVSDAMRTHWIKNVSFISAPIAMRNHNIDKSQLLPAADIKYFDAFITKLSPGIEGWGIH